MSTTIASAPISQSHKALQFLSDYAGPAALLIFGMGLWYWGQNENLFSFAAWGILDFLTGLAIISAGEKKAAVLPIAYSIICTFVVAMIWQNGKWTWTDVETICAAGTALGIILWWRCGPTWGVVAFAAAMLIASIPILFDTYKDPHPWELELWIGSCMSATTGLWLGRPLRLGNIEAWLFVAVSETVTISMIVLLSRPLWS